VPTRREIEPRLDTHPIFHGLESLCFRSRPRPRPRLRLRIGLRLRGDICDVNPLREPSDSPLPTRRQILERSEKEMGDVNVLVNWTSMRMRK
jgi:hypothetical protein